MAADDEQNAEMEQPRTGAKEPTFVELAGASGPAELAVAVAPDVASDGDR